ncbi:hypothetical protein B0H10DRAFT_2200102 [Mycena sp. CBHHK59/15]|nr:hypothetical protein B0H10DRAFT_2200102 [Mycena sp. CBHHK59/15]
MSPQESAAQKHAQPSIHLTPCPSILQAAARVRRSHRRLHAFRFGRRRETGRRERTRRACAGVGVDGWTGILSPSGHNTRTRRRLLRAALAGGEAVACIRASGAGRRESGACCPPDQRKTMTAVRPSIQDTPRPGLHGVTCTHRFSMTRPALDEHPYFPLPQKRMRRRRRGRYRANRMEDNEVARKHCAEEASLTTPRVGQDDGDQPESAARVSPRPASRLVSFHIASLIPSHLVRRCGLRAGWDEGAQDWLYGVHDRPAGW